MPEQTPQPTTREFDKEIRDIYRERNAREFTTPGRARRRSFGELFLVLVVAVTASVLTTLVVVGFWPPLSPLLRVERLVRTAPQNGEISQEVLERVAPAVVTVFPARSTKPATVLDQAYLAPEALGQGLVLSSDGWLVTTQGVVSDSQRQLTVVLGDGRLYPVDFIVLDPVVPLAFLKVNASNLVATAFVAQAGVAPAEAVAALSRVTQSLLPAAYPRYLTHVGARLVSNRADLVVSSETLPDRYLLDAALPPLSRGAPVVNARGEAIGLVADWGGELRSVLPLGSVDAVLESLFSKSQVSRPVLGLGYVQGSWLAALAEAEPPTGALIMGSPRQPAVAAKGPAAAAGLREGDRLVAIGGERLGSQSLTSLLLNFRPGSRINLTVVRGGQELTVQVTLGEVIGSAPDDGAD